MTMDNGVFFVFLHAEMKKAIRYILIMAVMGAVGYAIGLWASGHSGYSDPSEDPDFEVPAIPASAERTSLPEDLRRSISAS